MPRAQHDENEMVTTCYLLGAAGTVAAGFGDVVTLGGTRFVRRCMGTDEVVAYGSGYYRVGWGSGQVWWVLLLHSVVPTRGTACRTSNDAVTTSCNADGTISGISVGINYSDSDNYDSFRRLASVAKFIAGNVLNSRKTYTFSYNGVSQSPTLAYLSGTQASYGALHR